MRFTVYVAVALALASSTFASQLAQQVGTVPAFLQLQQKHVAGQLTADEQAEFIALGQKIHQEKPKALPSLTGSSIGAQEMAQEIVKGTLAPFKVLGKRNEIPEPEEVAEPDEALDVNADEVEAEADIEAENEDEELGKRDEINEADDVAEPDEPLAVNDDEVEAEADFEAENEGEPQRRSVRTPGKEPQSPGQVPMFIHLVKEALEPCAPAEVEEKLVQHGLTMLSSGYNQRMLKAMLGTDELSQELLSKIVQAKPSPARETRNIKPSRALVKA